MTQEVETKKLTRYIVTASFYINAENDADAIRQSNEIAENNKRYLDNAYSIDCLEESKFASVVRRKVNMNP